MNQPSTRERSGRGTMKRPIRAALWILVYLGLAVLPLVILLVGELPGGGGIVWDFAMGLGFGGLTVMGLQSILTARFRRATAPFGVDIIYYFHRCMAVGGFGLIAGHYVILRLGYGAALGPLNPLTSPWPMTAGRGALLIFAVLMVSSLWRRRLGIEYDRWRIGHALMAVIAVILAIAHVEGVGHYTRAVWKGWLWGGYSGMWMLAVAYVRIIRPVNLLRHPYRVVSVRQELGHSWTLTLVPKGSSDFTFLPGQFAWVTLRSSPLRAKEHPFSISSSAARPAELQFTIKELGDFTRTIKDVNVGELAYVDGPHGVFTTDHYPGAERFVFLAGGVGIAPIMSMLRTLSDRGDDRPLRLIYGNWRWDEILFREELESLRPRLRLEIVHVLQEAPPGWTDLTGVLSEDVLCRAIPAEADAAHFFVCGPLPMTASVQRTLRRRGVPMHRIHFERFDMA